MPAPTRLLPARRRTKFGAMSVSPWSRSPVSRRSWAGSLTLAGIGLLLAGTWMTQGTGASPTGPGDWPDLVYSVLIDCSGVDLRQAGTRADYTIVGISERGEEVSFTPDAADTRRLTPEDCRRGVPPFSPSAALPDSSRIRRFQVALVPGRRSDDALFLDSLQLTLTGPQVADSMAWDVDGGDGWCLSEDPGDARGVWRGRIYDGRCYPCLEFSLLPQVEGDSIVDGDWRHTAAPGYAECVPADAGTAPAG